MPHAVVGYGVTPCQVDEFPEKCERSRKGALYIRPRSSLTLTNDELEHIKAKYPHLYKKLRIVEDKPKRAPAKKAKEEKPPKAETPKPFVSSPSAGSGDASKKKKKATTQ